MQYAVSFSVFRGSQLASHTRDGNRETFEFPLLEIYDKKGQLVYVGHEARANILALRDFVDRGAASSLAGSPDLDRTMSEIRQAASAAAMPLPCRRGTIVAIDLDRCRACSLQSGYLSSVRPELLRDGIDIVQVDVVRATESTGRER
jgi:hypothetical protein